MAIFSCCGKYLLLVKSDALVFKFGLWKGLASIQEEERKEEEKFTAVIFDRVHTDYLETLVGFFFNFAELPCI